MAASMEAPKVCSFCGKRGTIDLTEEQADQYQRWDTNGRREPIQEGLWGWSPEMREMLITGIDLKCWKERVVGDMGDTEENEVEM